MNYLSGSGHRESYTLVARKSNKDDILKTQCELNNLVKMYQELCDNPQKNKTINTSDMMMRMLTAARYLGNDNGELFEMSFMGFLQIIPRLTLGPPNNFADYIDIFTDIMCDMSTKTGLRTKFVDRLHIDWFQYLENVPNTLKYKTFEDLKNNVFKKFVLFMTDANCISVQVQMLNILCSYLESVTKPRLCFIIGEFLNINSLKSNIPEPTSLTFNDKQWILKLINGSRSCRLIFGESIKSVKFGDVETIDFQSDGSSLFLNKPKKTVVFWMTYESTQTKVTISARKIKRVQIEDTGLVFINNLRLIINDAPEFETNLGKQIHPLNLQVNTIEVTFDVGFLRKDLETLILDMFGIKPEMRTSNDTVVSDDSDICIIETQEENLRKRSPSKPMKNPKKAGYSEVIVIDDDDDDDDDDDEIEVIKYTHIIKRRHDRKH